jgi:hypothetical protein
VTNAISMRVDISRTQAAFARAPQVMERHVDVKLARGAEEVARAGKGNAPKAFSNLVNSIRAERVGALHYQVAEGMNYGRAVEEGTRPHFPNPDALRPWVERVLGARGKEADDKAWMIARAISRRGTRAQPYMQPAAEASQSRLFDLVQQGADEGLKEVFG